MEIFTPEQIEKYSGIYRTIDKYRSLSLTEQVLTAYCDFVARICTITKDDYLYYTKAFETSDENTKKGYIAGKVRMAQDFINALSLKYIDLNKKSMDYSKANLTNLLRVLGKCDLQFQDAMPKVLCFNSLRLGLDPEINNFTNCDKLVVKDMKLTKPIKEEAIMKSIDAKTSENVR